MIGLYSYRTNNIGDDFQSYVLGRHLNIPLKYVWRDGAQDYQGPVTDLIINGFVTKQALPINKQIRSIFLAAWLGPLVMEDSEKVAVLKNWEPIGCRDTDTLKRCEEANLEAHFTGCPTILCKQHPDECEVPGSVLMVDVNPSLFESDGPHYRTQSAIRGPVTWASNIVDFNLTEEQRWQECELRHRLLSRSELIITNRIHVAIPALGMGKAVIFADDGICNPGRLTALPENVKRWTASECRTINLNPSLHRYEVANYASHVLKTIETQCSEVLGK